MWSVCVNADLLLPIGRGLKGQCFDIGACDLAAAIDGRVADAVVTFKPGQEALEAWQEVKGEALYAGAYGWTEADDDLKWMRLR